MNYQQHLESSKQLEEAFGQEVVNAQNAEVKSFYQKLASEQRTISNQLQSKVNNHTTDETAEMSANANQANANQANANQANTNARANNADAGVSHVHDNQTKKNN